MATSPKAVAAKTEETIQQTAAAVETAANEIAAPVRELAEKGVAQAKQTYSRFKSAAEETTDALEDAYATLSKGYKELGRKSVEATRSNVNAHFDFLSALLGAKSVSQAVELHTSYARKQFDVYGAQVKELSALAQKTATDGAKPFQEIASKGVKFAQAS
ncbi:phasin [Methylopila henanensis]|uniref:Phasin n=1 Tax=Methylopila henanensis TaxID=873516 RepID=A0ABW4K7Z8_9HYPH